MGNAAYGSSGNPLKDVIHGSNLPQSFSTRDERVEVTTNTAAPYCWICDLTIETQQGNKYSASGFKILIKPPVQNQIVLTTAHSLFIEGALAKRVTLNFPGQRSITVTSKNLWIPAEFKQSPNPNHNYGIIMLPGTSENGFSWTNMLSDEELTGRPLSCSGYTTDKSKGSLWITGGGVDTVTSDMITYMHDSIATSSGSVVYTWHKGHWIAIAIQINGGDNNSAVRLNVEMMRNIFQAICYPLQYSIQSKAFPSVYLCTNMNTLDIDREEEIVTIGYQMGNSQSQGVFELIPLNSASLELQLQEEHICISPAPCRDVYMHLEKVAVGEQGKVVVETMVGEIKMHHHETGCVSLESATNPGLYLSLSAVSPIQPEISNVSLENAETRAITCHYLPEKSKIRSTEQFILHHCSIPKK